MLTRVWRGTAYAVAIAGLASVAMLNGARQVNAIKGVTAKTVATHDTDAAVRKLTRLIGEYATSGNEALMGDIATATSLVTNKVDAVRNAAAKTGALAAGLVTPSQTLPSQSDRIRGDMADFKAGLRAA